MSITGHTRLAAVIGRPVRHSLSPTLLNAAFDAGGVDARYLAFEVDDAASALEAARTLGLIGLSVTMPFKDEVARTVDVLSDAAATLGAVNCVIVEADGTLRGENTDGHGFVAGLAEDSAVSPVGERVVVVGAGGAARAVVVGLADAGADDICVLNRTTDRAELAAALAGERGRVGSIDDVADAAIVVNATSLGMTGSPEAFPVDPDRMRPGQVAVDLVYAPLETRWMAALRERGIEAHNGVSMLVHQAARAYGLWTGSDAPVAEMRAAADRQLSSNAADDRGR